MPPRREHPAKGWAGILDRSSLIRRDIKQDTHYNQGRLTRETLRTYGLQLRPDCQFSEPGISASKPITRKELEKGIRAVVEEKVIEALVLQDVSRLSRLGMRHVGEMLDAVEAVGGRLIFHRGNLDSSKPQNRAIIAFLAEQAREEADTLSWRIGNWREGARIMGKWLGKRPYGYLVVDGRLVPHPETAPIVRRIVEDFLNGQSFREIAKSLNERGIPSPEAFKAAENMANGQEVKARTDTQWLAGTVAKILRSPALVAWQQHNGKIVLGPNGDPVSFGEGILTPGEHARVLAEIHSRTTIVRKGGKRQPGTKTGGGRPSRHLLVGFARCEACDLSMAATANNRPTSYYHCATVISGRSCPARAYIRIPEADAEVMHQLRTRLAAMDPDDPILDAIAERWREVMMPEGEDERAVLQSRLDAVRGRIVDLDEARYVRGEFTTPDEVARWDNMMERLKLQRDAVVEELEALGPPPDFDLNSLRATYREPGWSAAPLPQRRKWLQIAVAKVTIASAHKRKVPASDRVRVFLVGEETNPEETDSTE